MNEEIIEEITDQPIAKILKEPVLDDKGQFVEREDYIEEQNKQEMQQLKAGIRSRGFRLDNYIENAKRFYNSQPYHYDRNGIFWFWNIPGDYWEVIDDTEVMKALDKNMSFYGATITRGIRANYLEAVKRYGRDKIPLPTHPKWVQFKDKAYSLTSRKLYTVTPKYFFANPIPWEIGETDRTPVMDRLIAEWVGKEYVETMYEIIAYCCYTDYPIHLIFCLFGGGRNGKSCFIRLLTKFLGSHNCTSSDLELLSVSRFESFKLYKRLLCTIGETNFNILSKSSIIKRLTGQDTIGFEKKNKDPFDAHNYAKIIIASNSLPSTTDTSEGWWRRWLIIDFPNDFPEGKDILETVPEHEYNNLAKKVTQILPKLLEIGKFSNQGSIEHRKERYIMASNPLPTFIRDHCIVDDTVYIKYNELYAAYRAYLKQNKRRRVNRSEFKMNLEEEGFFVEKTPKKQIGEDQQAVFVSTQWIEGITIKKDSELCHLCHFFQNSHSDSYIENLNRNVGINSINSIKQQRRTTPVGGEIWQKCHICGLSPCIGYIQKGKDAGKPICEFCLEDFQEEIRIEGVSNGNGGRGR